jgi:hypothetical protein
MKLLIGDRGLVGKTILKKTNFDYTFNTSNIDLFEGIAKDGDEIFLSCLPATKWKVNKNIYDDFNNITNLIKILSKIKYSKIILISTIDVYNESIVKSNEDESPLITSFNYGSNRFLFEIMVKDLLIYDDLKIFRLPSLYSNDIKKNILYDLLNDNNVPNINVNSSYQWYNLEFLYDDITNLCVKYPNEKIFNLLKIFLIFIMNFMKNFTSNFQQNKNFYTK